MSEIMRIMNEIKNEGKDISYDQLKTRLEEIAPTQEQFDNLLELLDFVYYIGIEEGDSMGYKNALTDNNLSGDEEERVLMMDMSKVWKKPEKIWEEIKIL